jgi:hypothetical protein
MKTEFIQARRERSTWLRRQVGRAHLHSPRGRAGTPVPAANKAQERRPWSDAPYLGGNSGFFSKQRRYLAEAAGPKRRAHFFRMCFDAQGDFGYDLE